jgi:hypothetical protein
MDELHLAVAIAMIVWAISQIESATVLAALLAAVISHLLFRLIWFAV